MWSAVWVPLLLEDGVLWPELADLGDGSGEESYTRAGAIVR